MKVELTPSDIDALAVWIADGMEIDYLAVRKRITEWPLLRQVAWKTDRNGRDV